MRVDMGIKEIVLEGELVQNKTIQLMNIIGDVLFERKNNNNNEEVVIDVASYTDGIYELRIGDNSQGVFIC